MWDWMEEQTTTEAVELVELEGVFQGIKPNMTNVDK
jgi:hypothetical protein